MLGEHVTQAGSLVEPERLRFDFTHNAPLTANQILEIENLIHTEIDNAEPVVTKVMAHKAAIEDGALALFGEKYENEVRVVGMGDFSKELCGGTHVNNTAFIRSFKVVSEGGVSSGVRRVEAITGPRANQFMLKNTRENEIARQSVGLQGNWEDYLYNDDNRKSVINYIDSQKEVIKQLGKELQNTKGQQINIDDYIKNAINFSHDGLDCKLVTADVPMDDRKVLSEVTDKIRDKIQSGIVVVVGQGEASHPIVVTVSKNLVGPYKAGEVLKQVASDLGGKGGGRPDFAQGAGKNRQDLEQAFKNIRNQFTN